MPGPVATLAEQLGHRAADRLIIVNCDDIGSSHAANLASLEAAAERLKPISYRPLRDLQRGEQRPVRPETATIA